MDRFYEEQKTIRAYDVDFENKLKFNSVFNFMQDAAAVHAENMGFGFAELRKYDLAWVLSWAKVELISAPGFGDTIKIKTWPKCRHKLFSIRDFKITGNTGIIIGRATTAWLLLNTKTKRISDLQNLPAEIDYYTEEIGLDEFPEKLKITEEKEHIYSKKIRYSDIDINKHTNNTKYIEYTLDCYSNNFFTERKIKSLAINFLSESFEDNEIEIFKYKINVNGSDVIEGVDKSSGKPIFQSIIKWE